MTHQLDRIEEMLSQLSARLVGPSDQYLHKSEVPRLVLAMLQAILDGRQIEAIKTYRMLTGYGLKESKDEIEKITNRLKAA